MSEPVPYSAGVHANYDITFRIDKAGLNFMDDAPFPKSPSTIKDAEGLSISIDGQVEEWNAMDGEGWTRRFMTAKSISISMTAKRNVGDEGNDYIASVKSIVTLILTAVFAVLSIRGTVTAEQFLMIFTTIIQSDFLTV